MIGVVLRKRWLTAAALGLALPIYMIWIVLLDAAVHGWDDLKLLP